MTDHEALEALSKKAQGPGALLADKGAFRIALETAYRTGQLIPAPSVDEPYLCAKHNQRYGYGADCPDCAAAAISAMQVKP